VLCKAARKAAAGGFARSIKPGFNAIARSCPCLRMSCVGMWIPCSILSIGTAITPPQGSASSEQVACISGSSVSSCGLSQARYIVPRSVILRLFSIFYHIPGVTGTKRRSSPKKAKSRRNQVSTFHNGAGVVTHVYGEMVSTLMSKPPFWCSTSCRVDENSALHYAD
jgi:hypothetical protein